MMPGIAAAFVSAGSFTVAGDLTADFTAGVRVLADCGVDGTPLGVVTGSSYASPNTTVTVTLDSGSLTANLTHVWHGNDIPASLCNHAAQHMSGARDALTPANIGAMPADRRVDTVAPLYGGGNLWSNLNLGIAPADTDGQGTVELATSAEAVAGTDTARVPPISALRQAYRSWQRDDAGRFPGLILPAYNLFAPNLALPGTTAFSRASSGWVLGAAGIVKSYATNAPRYDYDTSGNLLGLRIEGAATRLNTIAAAPTAPENVTVTAQAYTISFYGTGSVVLSGAHAATVNGAGALPARVSYTFTPTAGTLTLTPSGTVQHLQVEARSFATSPILGEGSAVTRAADVATVALSGIDFNTAEGTIYCDFSFAGVSVQQRLFYVDDGTNNNVLSLFVSAGNKITMAATSSGTAIVYTEAASTIVANTMYKAAFSFKNNSYHLVVDGGSAVSDTSGAMPSSLTTLRLGHALGAIQPLYGAIRHFAYFPRALTTAQLQAMTL
ncbi:hypothetical protein G3N56_07745 [Desulfovibrio sulfodismutans]|uniref:Uncharacterized protein n=1 Tax=Desulfolutivibrio sulfodismutans TaxID=63561 RepID=A0A7K3NKA8_9BACT|nr:LamG-like jellyroll fold domain-containing protein [Desulfolutivibrio sulfodismutans]NDY56634.1 hypothetical protein [Desulfolutivibrio sulfodismutans]QLA11265.1 hypothetical protein GD606_02710 [Desulfolutivibrio sulfodismutans DSM 3696]